MARAGSTPARRPSLSRLAAAARCRAAPASGRPPLRALQGRASGKFHTWPLELGEYGLAGRTGVLALLELGLEDVLRGVVAAGEGASTTRWRVSVDTRASHRVTH